MSFWSYRFFLRPLSRKQQSYFIIFQRKYEWIKVWPRKFDYIPDWVSLFCWDQNTGGFCHCKHVRNRKNKADFLFDGWWANLSDLNVFANKSPISLPNEPQHSHRIKSICETKITRKQYKRDRWGFVLDVKEK